MYVFCANCFWYFVFKPSLIQCFIHCLRRHLVVVQALRTIRVDALTNEVSKFFSFSWVLRNVMHLVVSRTIRVICWEYGVVVVDELWVPFVFASGILLNTILR